MRNENARIALEAERREQQAERIATDRAAATVKAAQDEKNAALIALEAARLREEAARVEAAAVEAEDVARLSPRERNERRVARMLLEAAESEAGITLEAVPLADIQSELGFGRTTASEMRAAALTLLQDGYRPTA
ncbi:hypothetical protein [Streptomyces globisporus]|uniref:Uncharacterized protein n=1 Tax=Streptomyces globisporus TaxID=1908 RepID=A0A423UQB3_STRGL|nr:hypothetical protein [Streptomyces globisporus]ROV64511.1 hypothetical protein D3105_32440 [Streptomyces globisporus]